jgi:tetratricopeptide (TPR) repeat protein
MRNILKRSFLTGILMLFISIVAFASSEKMQQANTAYQQKEYKKAIQLYESLVAEGLESTSLYYNLGCAYFQENNLASSLLYFERAARLDPSNEDVQHNLHVVNSRLEDTIQAVPDFFLKSWFFAFTKAFSLKIWALISIMAFIILLFFIFIYLLSKEIRWKKTGFYLAIFFFLVMILSITAAQSQYKKRHCTSYAIVFEPTLTTKSSPDENSKNLFIIHEGTKVKIIDDVGDWYEIKIANGSKGWVEKDMIVII